jgi:hypothetical protein
MADPLGAGKLSPSGAPGAAGDEPNRGHSRRLKVNSSPERNDAHAFRAGRAALTVVGGEVVMQF